MPKLWNQTIEAHRREVHGAIMDTTAALVAEHGLRQVSMSQIAEQTGIGRATLYKYFPDVEAILLAWHERHVKAHLERLVAVRDQNDDAGARLEAVLGAWANIVHDIARKQHGADLTALLHDRAHVASAQRRLHELIRDVIADAAAAGAVRDDISIEELAPYCRHALDAAADLPTKAAVHRLVTLTLSALKVP